jgi:probable HAF family extracellular repeat protein
VVGESDDRPFRWLSGTLTMLPLGGPNVPVDRRGPPPRGSANAVNAEGLIAGVSDGSGQRHAVLWQADRVYDLNTLIDPNAGWALEEATGINASGQICGNGTLRGSACGFLLTPRSRAVR